MNEEIRLVQTCSSSSGAAIHPRVLELLRQWNKSAESGSSSRHDIFEYYEDSRDYMQQSRKQQQIDVALSSSTGINENENLNCRATSVLWPERIYCSDPSSPCTSFRQ